MGKVTTELRLTNRVDEILATVLPETRVRSLDVEDVLVDTGASLLCLPADIIARLGVPFREETPVKTATGVATVRLFSEVRLEVLGRTGTFDCLELPEGTDPLLGVIPLEALGLQPDVINHQLIALPKGPDRSYLSI